MGRLSPSVGVYRRIALFSWVAAMISRYILCDVAPCCLVSDDQLQSLYGPAAELIAPGKIFQ